MSTYRYRVVVSSATCANSVNSTEVELIVYPTATATTIPAGSTICEGGNTSFSAGSPVTGWTYQWQVNTGSGFTNINNGGVYSGAVSSILNITGATLAMSTYRYRVVVSSVACANSVNSNEAILTVHPPAVITNPTPVNNPICEGANTSFSIGSPVTGWTYQWQVNTGSGFANITDGGVYA